MGGLNSEPVGCTTESVSECSVVQMGFYMGSE